MWTLPMNVDSLSQCFEVELGDAGSIPQTHSRYVPVQLRAVNGAWTAEENTMAT